MKDNHKNLDKLNDLLPIMSFNGKESVETLGTVFHNYFEEKHSPRDIAADLGRRNIDKVQQIELHYLKFTHALCSRSWNMRFCLFLCCYYQRGHRNQENHNRRRA